MSDYGHSHDVAPGERAPAGIGVVVLIVAWLVMMAWFVPFAFETFRGIIEAVSR
jgi:hypothetical protein